MIYPLMALAGLVLALLSPPAKADAIARYPAGWVRITALPCADEAVKAHILARGGDPTEYRAASAEFKGKSHKACWMPLFDSALILMRYDDGEFDRLPFTDMQPVPVT